MIRLVPAQRLFAFLLPPPLSGKVLCRTGRVRSDPKGTGISASSDRSEDGVIELKYRFHDKMQKIVRHKRIKPGSRVHLEIGKPVAPDLDRVPPLACLSKDHDHYYNWAGTCFAARLELK